MVKATNSTMTVHTGTGKDKKRRWRIIFRCNMFYQIHMRAWRGCLWLAWSLLSLPLLLHWRRGKFCKRLFFLLLLYPWLSAKRQECLHSSTPEMHTNWLSMYTRRILNRMLKYTLCLCSNTHTHIHTCAELSSSLIVTWKWFILCVGSQAKSKRVSYFDCRNHMQIHR